VKKRSVSVDRRAVGDYLVQTFSRTVNGLAVMDGPPVRLPPGATAAELGAVVGAALGRSRDGLPPYQKGDQPDSPFLEFVGAHSYAQYCRGVREVSVQADEQIRELIVTSIENAGQHGGFTGIAGSRRKATHESAEELGRLVLAAFEHATE
jgi:hypothetical protein